MIMSFYKIENSIFYGLKCILFICLSSVKESCPVLDHFEIMIFLNLFVGPTFSAKMQEELLIKGVALQYTTTLLNFLHVTFVHEIKCTCTCRLMC